MTDQIKVVTRLLQELNSIGIPNSRVEKELPIASGYLYKVKMGIKTLGDDKMKLLQDYHASKIKKDKVPVIKIPVKNIAQPERKKISPPKKESKPGSLAEMMRELNSDTKRSVGTKYKRPLKI